MNWEYTVEMKLKKRFLVLGKNVQVEIKVCKKTGRKGKKKRRRRDD